MPWKKVEPMNQKKEFVLKIFGNKNFRALCQEYGISTKTGYKWKKRFMDHGWGGLEEGSRRPLSHAKGLNEAVVCEIIRLKTKHKFWGARKVRAVYAHTHPEVPSESSFKRVLGLWRSGARGNEARPGGLAPDAEPNRPTRSGPWTSKGGGISAMASVVSR